MALDLDAGIQMQRLMERIRRLQQGKPAPDLAQKEFIALHVIRNLSDNAQGGIKMSTLAHELHLSLPAVSKLIGNLEERGYVQRRSDPTSRRNVLLCLTEQGLQEEENAGKNVAKRTREIFAQLGAEDTEAFFRICRRLVDILENQPKKENEND